MVFMSDLVLPFSALTPAHDPLVGGKGKNLGALVRLGVRVPDGFCVTTAAWERFVEDDATFAGLLAELDRLQPGDLDAARRLGEALRSHLTSRPLPDDVRSAIVAALPDPEAPRAVRSSATAEDLPGASFAGQQDTYLNVVGIDAVCDAVRACQASLFTDRAILYRVEQGIPHDSVGLCAVVQRMVEPRAAGILFTADPATGHRGVMAVDAGFGLGEALVSGTISADLYRIDRATGRELEARIGRKDHAVRSVPGGGVEEVPLASEHAEARVLSADDLAALRDVGLRIEADRGGPQDIEWAFDDAGLHVLQARPITSLFPVPVGNDPQPLWFCFNHFQVMTDAVPPLVCDTWRWMLPLGRDPRRLAEPIPAPWMHPAGGRLWVDFGPLLRRKPTRAVLSQLFKGVDALARSAMLEVLERPGFHDGPGVDLRSVRRMGLPLLKSALSMLWFERPEGVLAERNAWMDALIARVRGAVLAEGTPVQRLDGARDALSALFSELVELPPRVGAGIIARTLLYRLLPERRADVDALGRGLDGNVTVAMDLAVGDLADAARERPAVAQALRDQRDWRGEEGAEGFQQALDAFLADWGMRAPSEIDWSRPRWREDPSSLLAAVAGNLAHDEPGAHRAGHARQAAEAEAAAQRLVAEAGWGWLGWLRRPLARRLVRVHRALMPLREHPKLALVQAGDALRTLVLALGADLVAAGRLDEPGDAFLLSWDALRGALADGGGELRPAVQAAREDLRRWGRLPPPRVMTGDGEMVRGEHARVGPDGALVGTAAAPGVVEGVARVVRDPNREVLHRGEVLVAPFTDPGWTPLFINAAALVMEVGGLMTHGSVVAREYGIPAVVCVPNATTRIRTGMRVRVHGDGGWVEILETGAQDTEGDAA